MKRPDLVEAYHAPMGCGVGKIKRGPHWPAGSCKVVCIVGLEGGILTILFCKTDTLSPAWSIFNAKDKLSLSFFSSPLFSLFRSDALLQSDFAQARRRRPPPPPPPPPEARIV